VGGHGGGIAGRGGEGNGRVEGRMAAFFNS